MATSKEIEDKVNELYNYAVVIARNSYKGNSFNVIDVEDVESAALVGLFDAASKYTEDRGDFKKYASIRIRGAIKDLYRSKICDYSRFKGETVLKTVSISNHTNSSTDEDDSESFMNSIFELEDKVDEVINVEHAKHCINSLSELHREVVDLYLEGVPLKCISESMGKSQSWSSYMLRKARKIMQDVWWGVKEDD